MKEIAQCLDNGFPLRVLRFEIRECESKSQKGVWQYKFQSRHFVMVVKSSTAHSYLKADKALCAVSECVCWIAMDSLADSVKEKATMCSTNPFEDTETLEQVSLQSMENGGENLYSAEKSDVIGKLESELTSVPSDSEQPKSPDGPKSLLKRSSLGRLSSRLLSGLGKDGEGKREQRKSVNEDQSERRKLSELISVPNGSEEPKSPDGPKSLLKRSSLGRLSSRLLSGLGKDGEGKQEQRKSVSEDQSECRKLSGPESSVPGDNEEPKSPDGSLPTLKRGGLGRLSSKILSGLRKDGNAKQGLVKAVAEIRAEEVETPLKHKEPEEPLSVMEIHDLINKGVLEEAHIHLLLLKKELDSEASKTVQEGTQSELLRKTKDMELLCGTLRNKLKSIVKDSLNNSQDLLTNAVKIIVEEDKREHDPSYSEASCLKGPQEWKELWREAVQEGVRDRIANVPIAKREDNQSWLAVHLALLGKSIVDDLESVKTMVQKCYPEDFGVCNTYVASSHQEVSSHLQKIMQQKLEVNEWYALLNWTINCYESDKIMGNLVLKPEVNTEGMDPLLDKDTLENMKTNYITGLQVQLKHCLENMLNIESEKNWETKDEPEILNGYYHSEIQIDITEMVHRYVATSREIDTDLEERVLCTCSEELKHFSRHFNNTFMEWRTSSPNSALQKSLSIAYINSFSNIKTEMDKYKEKCPAQIEQLNNELDKVIQDLGATLLADFIQETEPYFKKLMTKRWLSCEDDFEKIMEIIENHSELYKKMKQPCFQKCVNGIHYSAVKGYVTQIMKKNYSCKNRKHERAAAKIKVESEALRSHFDDMGTTSKWLHSAALHLGDIVGVKNKRDIKETIQPLVSDFPDISKEHVSAILYFRGITKGPEKQAILQRLQELKSSPKAIVNRSRLLFGAIVVPKANACLPLT
ncbi:exocyst complex component 3-like protein 4 isoform X2 [Polyodon spathula]|uniref:exocyst complex component 3-like protein 4 isoform X2 n=1 Tax=Polyodon spathula TaxID=7913 RepID=UPI001B7E371E|nr:exocyst complex component 3-like protein 4 isoform X2 [Polyodon spathula]